MTVSKQLTGYELHSAITGRLSALSELQAALRRAEQNEDEVREALLAVVPKSMQQFVQDEDVISSLFKYGRCSTNIVFKRYNLKDFAAAKAAAQKLKKVWAKQVTVHVGTNPEPHRVDIRFGIAQL